MEPGVPGSGSASCRFRASEALVDGSRSPVVQAALVAVVDDGGERQAQQKGADHHGHGPGPVPFPGGGDADADEAFTDRGAEEHEQGGGHHREDEEW
ncbi:hypothetical protein Tfu_0989 [Thermobifida fusca YX]|uniref:Uncharacterized protein n=1 Tax=Thermobifida fusca (strain YX) TaxID=269800 RepID=Q47R90_THEFY|nr:hypothetical protein Tfu_0989 [Thermobifida fusca YX]